MKAARAALHVDISISLYLTYLLTHPQTRHKGMAVQTKMSSI